MRKPLKSRKLNSGTMHPGSKVKVSFGRNRKSAGVVRQAKRAGGNRRSWNGRRGR